MNKNKIVRKGVTDVDLPHCNPTTDLGDKGCILNNEKNSCCWSYGQRRKWV